MSGPGRPPPGDPVGRLFQRLLAASFFFAWASLGVQVDVLIGSHGLLPARDLVEKLAEHPELSFFDAPTLFRWGASDAALHGGIVAGVLLSVIALFGIAPRLAFAAMTLLYLSYAVVARSFLSFQWDNLLLECGLFGALVSPKRRVAWVTFLIRVALFKLYFESGLAKYQSPLGDWKDGTAMAYYYETAPIPTWMAWYAHHLPAAWHAIESRVTLIFELGVPFLIFGPRPARLVAFSVFSAFQLLNIATANYGFFSYLALVLQVSLLEPRDLARARTWLAPLFGRTRPVRARLRLARIGRTRRWARLSARFVPSDTERLGHLARLSFGALMTIGYLAVSLEGALGSFAPEAPRSETLATLGQAVASLRLVNTYHLFAQITRERIEPTFETYDGTDWTPHDFHYKPGDPTRAPPFVAPHQPRVDFLLWFYGLGYESGVPLYVRTLLTRMCSDPGAVQTLFVTPLPATPHAVRVAFYQYHFTTPEQRRETSAWWTREEVGRPGVVACSTEAPQRAPHPRPDI